MGSPSRVIFADQAARVPVDRICYATPYILLFLRLLVKENAATGGNAEICLGNWHGEANNHQYHKNSHRECQKGSLTAIWSWSEYYRRGISQRDRY